MAKNMHSDHIREAIELTANRWAMWRQREASGCRTGQDFISNLIQDTGRRASSCSSIGVSSSRCPGQRPAPAYSSKPCYFSSAALESLQCKGSPVVQADRQLNQSYVILHKQGRVRHSLVFSDDLPTTGDADSKNSTPLTLNESLSPKKSEAPALARKENSLRGAGKRSVTNCTVNQARHHCSEQEVNLSALGEPSDCTDDSVEVQTCRSELSGSRSPLRRSLTASVLEPIGEISRSLSGHSHSSTPTLIRNLQKRAAVGSTKRPVKREPYSKLQMQMVDGAPNTTSVEYWDTMSDRWEKEIQNTLMEERNRVIQKALDEFVKGADLVVDVGCGVGNYLIALASRAHSVVGIDISPGCIKQAQKKCDRYGIRNCKLFVVDLGLTNATEDLDLGIPSASVVLCVNAMISPDSGIHRKMLTNAHHMLRAPSAASNSDGGVLLLVVPSVESVQLEQEQHRNWVKQRRRRRLPRLRSEREEPTCKEDEAKGVYCISGVRTKHFFEHEVSSLVASSGCMILRIERVMYDWNTDAKAGEPRPYDWLVVARRSSPASAEVGSSDP